jgi:hypothetical protein
MEGRAGSSQSRWSSCRVRCFEKDQAVEVRGQSPVTSSWHESETSISTRHNVCQGLCAPPYFREVQDLAYSCFDTTPLPSSTVTLDPGQSCGQMKVCESRSNSSGGRDAVLRPVFRRSVSKEAA